MSDRAIIRLVILTDNPEKAALAVFGCRFQSLPTWVLVMSDYREIEKLEEGAPCLPIWFPHGRTASIAEQSWRERREVVSLDDDFGKHFARISDWLAKRDAAEKALCDQAVTEMAENSDLVTFDEIVTAQAASRAVETATIKKFPKPNKWS